MDGTYGVGKSTVANCISEVSNGEYICIDPDDYFNSYPEHYMSFGWPTYNNKAIQIRVKQEVKDKTQEKNIVIPLTMPSSKWRQIWVHMLKDLTELYHIVLLAEKKQILSRINSDVHRDRSFALENLDENLKYYQCDIEGSIKIDTTRIPPEEVANKILKMI